MACAHNLGSSEYCKRQNRMFMQFGHSFSCWSMPHFNFARAQNPDHPVILGSVVTLCLYSLRAPFNAVCCASFFTVFPYVMCQGNFLLPYSWCSITHQWYQGCQSGSTVVLIHGASTAVVLPLSFLLTSCPASSCSVFLLLPSAKGLSTLKMDWSLSERC